MAQRPDPFGVIFHWRNTQPSFFQAVVRLLVPPRYGLTAQGWRGKKAG